MIAIEAIFAVSLPPGTEILLKIGLTRYATAPTYKTQLD